MKNLLQNSAGKLASSARFGKPRLLIFGCGDVGMRLLPLLQRRFRVFAVSSQASRCAELRDAGAQPVLADLDHPHTLGRLGQLAQIVVHLAPPQPHGNKDQRTRNLAAILPEHTTLVYISTSGVYGDCGGVSIDETRAVNPHNARAQRRVDAEQVLRAWARRRSGRLSILRVPGIYADDRLPVERLIKGTPALRPEDDVYTNHIHADDLAQIIFAAIFKGAPSRVYHAVDDSEMKMGDYFDAVATAFGLPLAPRLPREQLTQQVSPMLLSFMSESRRMQNGRIKAELGVRLRYPEVHAALREMTTVLDGD
ncbi:SDR family oxidoreductase [Glaciimonas immobilis]|uniref:Nucleoside-diphosphate-sugar epimerase n=1 Tax=Glaciimonas immobilis TaxID=728004 RepID=A0A840RR00_9BURK|nr:SDR family oxidoreductase [Glaciimonas immobilis]KAF3997801.1 SDR family oxidoreductase [Glaciimonas immobilis]MBB5199572.1 nucleoside-diphosphate-sugar epimerase [Glaciimonas immobilis]